MAVFFGGGLQPSIPAARNAVSSRIGSLVLEWWSRRGMVVSSRNGGLNLVHNPWPETAGLWESEVQQSQQLLELVTKDQDGQHLLTM
eukprot:g31505.t1